MKEKMPVRYWKDIGRKSTAGAQSNKKNNPVLRKETRKERDEKGKLITKVGKI